MCADCVCSAAGDCVLVMAMVRFDTSNAIGHVSLWTKDVDRVFEADVVKNILAPKRA